MPPDRSAYMKEWRRTTGKVKHRQYELKRSYNMTPAEYDAMLEKQNDRCAICGLEKEQSLWQKLQVDHDHQTKEVRGLLCNHCNLGLGGFRDDPKLIRAALSYLGA